LVDVLEVEERWKWEGVEWSRYRAAVRQYIINRTGSEAQTNETWWPPPWSNEKSPFMDVEELLRLIRSVAGE